MGSHGRPARVIATEQALAAIDRLRADRGPVVFFQSGGCCDGSLPICLEEGEMLPGSDVLLGRVGECEFFIDHRLYEIWKPFQLTLAVAEGAPEGFSLPAGEDGHFVTISRLFGADELEALRADEGRPIGPLGRR